MYATADEVAVEGWSWPSSWTTTMKTNAIQLASDRIDAVTRDKWESATKTIIISGRGTSRLYLGRIISWPILTVTDVYYRDDYDPSDNFVASGELVATTDYYISDSRRALFRAEATFVRSGWDGITPTWIRGHRNYRVRGTFGRSTTPEAIKRACVLLVREEAEPGYTSEFAPMVSEKFADGYQYTQAASGSREVVVSYLTGFTAVDVLLAPYVSTLPLMV